MSAAAPTFTPLEQQQNQWMQAQAAHAAQLAQAQQSEEMTQMWYSKSSNEQDQSSFGFPSAAPATRALQIVDPSNGQAIERPQPTKTSALDYLEVKAPARKAMSITDPSTGKAVDTFTAVNFKPAEAKKMDIIDPNSGANIKI
jgi:hypothetical protein